MSMTDKNIKLCEVLLNEIHDCSLKITNAIQENNSETLHNTIRQQNIAIEQLNKLQKSYNLNFPDNLKKMLNIIKQNEENNITKLNQKKQLTNNELKKIKNRLTLTKAYSNISLNERGMINYFE